MPGCNAIDGPVGGFEQHRQLRWRRVVDLNEQAIGLLRLVVRSEVVQCAGLQTEAILVVGIIGETLFHQFEGAAEFARGGSGLSGLQARHPEQKGSRAVEHLRAQPLPCERLEEIDIHLRLPSPDMHPVKHGRSPVLLQSRGRQALEGGLGEIEITVPDLRREDPEPEIVPVRAGNAGSGRERVQPDYFPARYNCHAASLVASAACAGSRSSCASSACASSALPWW